MVDWVQYVRERLDLHEVRPEWESEVVEDLARQLEDAHRDALSRGQSEREAEVSACRHISDWQQLRQELIASRRARLPILDRWYDHADQSGTLQKGGWRMFADLRRDLLHGLRIMSREPAFASMAILALALGIGANTAIFSVVNTVILRPLPYQDPDRLVLVQESIPKAGPGPFPVSAPDVLDFAQQNHVFEAVAGFEGIQFELTGAGEPAQIKAARVGAGLFPLLGIQPLLGRTFSNEEDQPGRRVTILSYSLWQSRFGGDPNMVGKTVALDRQPYTVIGIMPQSFIFPIRGIGSDYGPAVLWVPIAFGKEELGQRGDNFNIDVVARLKRGITIEHAHADADAIARRIQDTYPAEVRGDLNLGAVVTPMREQVVGKVKTLMAILLGAVGLVLLIACANVANLLLARAAKRQKEIAIRSALGAGRGRLLRQFVSESLLLSVASGAAGLLIAHWGALFLAALAPGNIPRIEDVALDVRVFLFAAILSLVSGLAFGSAPALAACRTDLVVTLKEGGRGTMAGRGHHRLRAALVISEVAVTLVLLIGAGLLIRSFERVRETDPGFQPQHVLTMSVNLPHASYSRAPQLRSFYRELLMRVRQLPGADAVGMSTDLPMLAAWTRIFTAEGYQPGADAPLNLCKHSIVYGDYFKAMGIPLVRGRYFSDDDRSTTKSAIIVSNSIAKRYFAGQDPIGKRVKWGLPQSTAPWLTVVGVVGDVKQGALDVATQPHTYEPYAQCDDGTAAFLSGLNISVRTSGDPTVLSAAARAQIWSLDRQLAVSDIRTMTDVIRKSMASRRFDTLLMSIFAASALLLAAIGLYGVISYSVTQRIHEIGVRMALGAARRDVVRLVVGQGMILATLGLVVGLGGAFGLTRILSSMLFEIPSTDPLTFLIVSLAMVGVAFLASYIPSRRATRVDPIAALRCE